MKIIFLDFDGVLNSVEWFKRLHESGEKSTHTSFFERHCSELNPVGVKLVNDLAIETQAKVVVSSSWRALHPIAELREIVAACGWTAPEFIDITPRSEKGFRGDEVRAWLTDSTKRHVEILEPITHHVIFDDDGDFHSDQPLVKTSWETGLLPSHVDAARKILLNTDE